MEIDENRYEYASPNASSLIQSLRAFGYHISTAIADLLDNSISAKAKNINVQFEWNDGNPWIAIFDDGCGMTAYELVEAMKLGSKSPLDERKENDLGRFGLGLKTASFSQCKCLTVMTKTQNTDIAVRCWDLDLVTQYNYWVLKKYGSENSEAIAKKFFTTNSQGTIVLLEKIDRIVPDNFIDNETYQEEFLANAKRVSEHISTVFSGYMYGKKE